MRHTFLNDELIFQDPEEKNVTFQDPAPIDEGSPEFGKPKTGRVVNSRYVRLRKSPTGGALSVKVLNSGDCAEILDRVPGYYKVKTINGGHTGFIPSNYFKED